MLLFHLLPVAKAGAATNEKLVGRHSQDKRRLLPLRGAKFNNPVINHIRSLLGLFCGRRTSERRHAYDKTFFLPHQLLWLHFVPGEGLTFFVDFRSGKEIYFFYSLKAINVHHVSCVGRLRQDLTTYVFPTFRNLD